MTELPIYEFHLTAFEVGILIGALMKNGMKIRKELMTEIDKNLYMKK